MPASSGSRESPVVKKMRLKRVSSRPSALSLSRKPSAWSPSRRSASASVAVDRALGELVDLVVGDQPDLLGLADQRRVGLDHLAQLRGGTGADEPAQHAAVLAARWRPGTARSRLSVISAAKLAWPMTAGIARALRIDDRRVEGDVELDVGLAKGRPALGDDGEQQDAQEPQRQGDGTDAQPLEQRPRADSASGSAPPNPRRSGAGPPSGGRAATGWRPQSYFSR